MKIITSLEAAKMVRDGDAITSEGFLNSMFPEKLVTTLEQQFLETGHPCNLVLTVGAGKGTGGWENKGLNHFAHEGFIRKFVGSHTGVCRKLEQMVAENKIAGYTYPQGIASQLFRAAGSGQPGILTRVGIGTFIDPRVGEGCKMNALADEEMIDVVSVNGEDFLYYKAPPIDIAFLRGTTADTNGNISIEKEAINLDVLPIVLATKRFKGIVIFQVERICVAGTLHPRAVKIPGPLVDYVVVSEPEFHQQTLTYSYNPGYTGELKIPALKVQGESDLTIYPRTIIQRRAALELKDASGILNLGIGTSDGVMEEMESMGLRHQMVSTCEAGTIGGIPATGLDFGAAINPEAIVDMVDMFAIYDGYGLDYAVLGMGQVDRYGNVNVTKFGPRSPGPGGFIDISQNARKVIFTGSFTTGGFEAKIDATSLQIISEGKIHKLVNDVEHISFSGVIATQKKQDVWYVTERAVFHLEDGEMVLVEIAPGIDVEKDVLGQMDFVPVISPQLHPMDPMLFKKYGGEKNGR